MFPFRRVSVCWKSDLAERILFLAIRNLYKDILSVPLHIYFVWESRYVRSDGQRLLVIHCLCRLFNHTRGRRTLSFSSVEFYKSFSNGITFGVFAIIFSRLQNMKLRAVKIIFALVTVTLLGSSSTARDTT